MKRVRLLLIGLLCLSIAGYAGEVITNDTGEDATGLRVVFSTPVLITAFGDILPSVEAQMLSFEHVFSGGIVKAWESHWFNYSPATASVIETEWLSQPVHAEAATVVEHWRSDVFELTLPAEDGGAALGTITRTMSVEQIPFVVEYKIELIVDHVNVVWTSERPSVEEPSQIVEGSTARFVYRSNHTDPEVSARFEIDGQEYQWTDPDLSFPLHNWTEISLDASVFYPGDEISVVWLAANGDPADAVTFPIADPEAATTTLVSDWPNVLTVSCDITRQDGSTVSEDLEALIYFRDGTPFEIRSVASTVNHPMSVSALDEVLDQEFDQLRSLGVNTITTHILWWFGPPDEDGNWKIHPIWQSRSAWPFDQRGNTILTEDLGTLVTRAHEEGFRVYVQLLQYPYYTNRDLEWDYTTWDPTTRTSYSFRATEGWWIGEGEGLNNMFLFYLEDFIRLGVDGVFLSAENGGLEQSGGLTTQEFYDGIIEQYREAGYTGCISYASGFDGQYGFYEELLRPGASGIPYESMDAVGATYYPILADTANASTIEMQDCVRGNIETFFRPISQVYNLPAIIADCYCQAYEGCAVNPFQTSGNVDEECSRRYFSAILRAFAAANIASETPFGYVGLPLQDIRSCWIDMWATSSKGEVSQALGSMNLAAKQRFSMQSKCSIRTNR